MGCGNPEVGVPRRFQRKVSAALESRRLEDGAFGIQRLWFCDRPQRIPAEAYSAKQDRGYNLHPELFDHAGEWSIPQIRHSGHVKRQSMQETK